MKVLNLTDPVNKRKVKFGMDGRSLRTYKSKVTKGTIDMVKGQDKILEGRRLQRKAFNDLLRYGTVVAIIDHVNDGAAEKTHQASQEAIRLKEAKEDALLALQMETQQRKNEIEQKFALLK
jgi:hypothetical protein